MMYRAIPKVSSDVEDTKVYFIIDTFKYFSTKNEKYLIDLCEEIKFQSRGTISKTFSTGYSISIKFAIGTKHFINHSIRSGVSLPMTNFCTIDFSRVSEPIVIIIDCIERESSKNNTITISPVTFYSQELKYF